MPVLPSYKIEYETPERICLSANANTTLLVGGLFFVFGWLSAVDLVAPALLGHDTPMEGNSWPFALISLLISTHLYFRNIRIDIDGRKSEIFFSSKVLGIFPKERRVRFSQVSKLEIEQYPFRIGKRNQEFALYLHLKDDAVPIHLDSNWKEKEICALSSKIATLVGVNTEKNRYTGFEQ